MNQKSAWQVLDQGFEELELYRTILSNISDAVFLTDGSGAFVYICSNVQVIFGYSQEEVMRQGNIHFLLEGARLGGPLPERKLLEPVRLESQREITNVEYSIQDRYGRVHHLLVNIKRVSIGRATVLYTCRDISERKNIELVLQTERAYFQQLFEGAPEAIVLVDNDNRILRANGEFLNLFGYGRDELLGRSLDELLAPPDLLAEARALSQQVRSGAQISVETVRQNKDGRRIDVSVLGAPIVVDQQQIAVFGIYRNLSGKKKEEDRIRQAQKMEAVGRLSGGIAHDFNNLLTAILGYTELVLSEDGLDGVVKENLGEIKDTALRAADLTDQLLAFSHKQPRRPRVIDLNKHLGDLSKLLKRLIGENIRLETCLDPELGPICLDPSQVEQVLMNLAVNARDAMPRGGVLTIETKNVFLDKGYMDQRRVSGGGPYVLIAVSDTGKGMDEQIKKNIFDPFFTTKGPDQGTGLGLSTVYGIVKQNDGFIWVCSEPDQGSCFQVYFPRVNTHPPSAEPRQDPETEDTAVSGGRETILVVEDDDILRKLTLRVLKSLGYAVLEAANGEAAMELAATPATIDLLLTDVVMPGMNGCELAVHLQKKVPGLPVIYVSGYSDDAVLQHGVQEEHVFLQKPFSRQKLLLTVRSVLDKA